MQSNVSLSSRTYTGGLQSRHVNWFSRLFWRTWFEFDRVMLDEGRRDYLEYRFGTILSIDKRWPALASYFLCKIVANSYSQEPPLGWHPLLCLARLPQVGRFRFSHCTSRRRGNKFAISLPHKFSEFPFRQHCQHCPPTPQQGLRSCSAQPLH